MLWKEFDGTTDERLKLTEWYKKRKEELGV